MIHLFKITEYGIVIAHLYICEGQVVFCGEVWPFCHYIIDHGFILLMGRVTEIEQLLSKNLNFSMCEPCEYSFTIKIHQHVNP